VGRALAERGYRWREWEQELVDRWGGREAFVANKDEALPAFHAELRAWLDAGPPAATIESTGLSDASLLDELDASERIFLARFDLEASEAARRCAERPAGEHLTDEPADATRVIAEHERLVRPTRRVDLVVDATEPIDTIVDRIVAALASEPRSHRRSGVAHALWSEAAALARAEASTSMYISATPTGSAVGFHVAHGAVLADPVHSRLLAMRYSAR
jgi:hypothetical protein